MALNDIIRSQPSSLSLLFPSAQPSEVYKLYAHASLPTILAAYQSCSKFFTRALSALLITSVAAAAHQMILDLLIALLRTRTFWHPHVYGLRSRIYHTPVPLLALTAKRIAELSYDAFVSVEEYLHRCGIDLESHMLNADLYRHTVRRKVITESHGSPHAVRTTFRVRSHM
uniref:Uncharacterized protein n=1 Tax=Babesia bovis TaxID=5865 RepID=S6CB61_BABBO|nr:hypothetical protein [Babesia bovis]